MIDQLEIIYEDEQLVAVNKPHGLLVHRTPLAKDATEFALQILRDQLGYRIYPTHRIDRKTSGVLLFAKTKTYNSLVQEKFKNREVKKSYLAIVRGFTKECEEINYELDDGSGPKEAISLYTLLRHYEINIPSAGFLTSRYSLIRLTPSTGRYHQLRKHMAHIFHPIIGDRPHGCNKQNRLWKHEFGHDKMLLHAESLELSLPHNKRIKIAATPSSSFDFALDLFSKHGTNAK